MNTNTIKNKIQALALTILGEPASKANSRRMVFVRGKTMFIKSAKALEYAKSFKQQVGAATQAGVMLEGNVAIHITIYYASRRPDLDESLILDLLQGVAYENDRQVKEKHIYWGLDKEKPRCEIRVEKIKGS
jgi:Holliday junction resolvase RusA-like endonuclease